MSDKESVLSRFLEAFAIYGRKVDEAGNAAAPFAEPLWFIVSEKWSPRSVLGRADSEETAWKLAAMQIARGEFGSPPG